MIIAILFVFWTQSIILLMMAILKVSDVVSRLHPKATKATITQVCNFLNGEVIEDLRSALADTFEDDMKAVYEVDVDVAVATEYALPTDFYTAISTVNSKGERVSEGILTSLDNNRNKILFGSDTEGLPIVTIDAGSTLIKLIISYEKVISDVSQSDDPLPFPTHISKKILAILAKGVSYYYLRSRKKTTEVQFIFNEYEDLKSSIFQMSIISL